MDYAIMFLFGVLFISILFGMALKAGAKKETEFTYEDKVYKIIITNNIDDAILHNNVRMKIEDCIGTNDNMREVVDYILEECGNFYKK